MEADFSEYKCKLFDIINAIDYLCVNTLKYERVISIGEEQSKIIKYFM